MSEAPQSFQTEFERNSQFASYSLASELVDDLNLPSGQRDAVVDSLTYLADGCLNGKNPTDEQKAMQAVLVTRAAENLGLTVTREVRS